jgi:ketosteroid isomerase-like protein
MAIAEVPVARAWVDAIVAQDVAGAAALLHPEIDFRAMTPNRVWEAEGPAGVEAILREWFEDPDEDVQRIEATPTVAIGETLRVGWLVHISDADGPHIFEQQAYVRERDGRIAWMRVMCSGWIPLGPSASS